ncbi:MULTISPECIES: hypothetical protein [Methylomonas]|uniref:hypothetical protein n=1 Tax=Methylomonas TaxID=416 RepID=UPI0012319E27|nr:hypothetical protein [Methylomonas rhizoryzae]
MANDNRDDKKKVALNQATYDELKTFTRLNALKLRVTIDVMVELMLKDEALRQRIVEFTLEKQEAQKKG